jgi:hypothetical protein
MALRAFTCPIKPQVPPTEGSKASLTPKPEMWECAPMRSSLVASLTTEVVVISNVDMVMVVVVVVVVVDDGY